MTNSNSRSDQNFNVGVFVDSIGTYGRGVTRGILAYRRYRRWSISAMRTWVFEPLAFIEKWAGDGLIAMVPDEQISASIARTGKPVVCVSSLLPELHRVSVLADDFAVGQLAANHFIDRGFRNFAFYGQKLAVPVLSFVFERERGFASEIEAAGFSSHSIGDMESLEALLRTIRLPAAVFAANDEHGVRVISLAERVGLRVPEQIAVVGVDNDDLLAELGNVSLSSIALPTYEIGFEAAALLNQVMQGNAPASTLIKLPPVGVITRKSSDITAIDDPDLTTALAFIRQHAADPINVSDVVAAVPVSRRVLERRFQKHLQRSTLEEIQRVHIERAASLLIDTKLSIVEVARASGFASRSRFHASFARDRGHTPAEFRQIYRDRTAARTKQETKRTGR